MMTSFLVAGAFVVGVSVGGSYGGFRGLRTELRLWLRERIK